jgi:hypothetical protein
VARPGLEITLKGFCLRPAGKGDVSYQTPRLEFRCVGGFAGVMISKALFEVGGQTHIALTGSGYAFNKINIIIHVALLR